MIIFFMLTRPFSLSYMFSFWNIFEGCTVLDKRQNWSVVWCSLTKSAIRAFWWCIFLWSRDRKSSDTGQIVLMLWLNSIYQIYDVKKLLLNFSHWQMFCVYCMLCVSYSRMCKLWWRHWIRIWSRISFLPSQEKRSEDGHSHVSAFIFYLRTCTDFYFSLFVFVGSSSSTTGWRCLLWK